MRDGELPEKAIHLDLDLVLSFEKEIMTTIKGACCRTVLAFSQSSGPRYVVEQERFTCTI